MQPRLLARAPWWGVALVAAAALTVPASASAAALGVTNPKPCFGAGDIVGLGGSGFTPGATISFGRDNAPIPGNVVASAAGGFLAPALVPQLPVKKRGSIYGASDGVNAAVAPPIAISRLAVRLRPARGRPSRPRRVIARGFTARGRKLYVHRVRKGRSKNRTVGRLKGDCKTINRKRRFFKGTRPGTYRVQFDVFRRYNANRRQRVVFRLRVFRRVVRRSQAASAAGAGVFGRGGAGFEAGSLGTSWERID